MVININIDEFEEEFVKKRQYLRSQKLETEFISLYLTITEKDREREREKTRSKLYQIVCGIEFLSF